MMINGRLIGMVPKSKRYVAAGVALQWVGLLANMTMILVVCVVLERLYERTSTLNDLIGAAVAMVLAAAVRAGCAMLVTRMGHLASCEVKRTVRHRIYEKLLALGPSYRERAMTSEVVQVAVEGVDQLETYFGAYLPQLFYALLAPLTLFCVVATISLPAAVVLLVCVPLIPIAIAAVQTWAKRLLGHYWGQYTELGDTFLENLQGLTTLKVYQADGFKQDQMNEQAEKFRRITMRVLTLALMGSFGPCTALANLGSTLQGTLAAGNRVLDILDEEPATADVTGMSDLDFRGVAAECVGFSYGTKRVLEDISLEAPQGAVVGIAGRSGSGKSTLLRLFMRFWDAGEGSVSVSGRDVRDINTSNLRAMESLVTQETHLFHDTIRNNVRIARLDATDEEVEEACRKASVHGFVASLPQGYDTQVGELGSTLSGGERQRLGLARAFLHEAPLLLLDEPTSNLDALNEGAILRSIREEGAGRTVLLVSHRPSTMRIADTVVPVENGRMS